MFDFLKKKNKEPEKEYKHFQFNVAGVTFDNTDGTNRQAVLKKLAQYLLTCDDPYGGLTNKDIIEDDLEVSQVGHISAPAHFEESTFEGKPCVEVHCDYGLIGFIPGYALDEFFDLCEKYEHATADAYVTGGKYKYVESVWSDDKMDFIEKVKTGEKTYGMHINMTFQREKQK